MFCTLRSKLVTKFWNYLLNIAAISKSSASTFLLLIRDLSSDLVDLSQRKLYGHLELLSSMFLTFKFEQHTFLVFFNKLKYWLICLSHFFLSQMDLRFRNYSFIFDLSITAHWVSLFIKGAWFAHINLLFLVTLFGVRFFNLPYGS